jgi:hypothetical protein
MPTTTPQLKVHDASGWQTGAGNWCYAAATRAVRGALLGEQLSLEEIAHNFYRAIGELGGPDEAGIGGTRGAAIAKYLTQIHFSPGGDFPYSYVQAWVAAGQLGVGVDPRPLLREAWGDLDLTGLNQDTVTRSSADEANELRICQTIDAGGLVVVGTALHFKVIYGYELDTADDDDTRVVARRFLVWDAGTGVAATPADLADFDGDMLTFATR